jgi:hypothetical protein
MHGDSSRAPTEYFVSDLRLQEEVSKERARKQRNERVDRHTSKRKRAQKKNKPEE